MARTGPRQKWEPGYDSTAPVVRQDPLDQEIGNALYPNYLKRWLALPFVECEYRRSLPGSDYLHAGKGQLGGVDHVTQHTSLCYRKGRCYRTRERVEKVAA